MKKMALCLALALSVTLGAGVLPANAATQAVNAKATATATMTCYHGIILGNKVNFRKSASTSSKVLDQFYEGDTVTVLDNGKKTNGFYHVRSGQTKGYVYAKYVQLTYGWTENK